MRVAYRAATGLLIAVPTALAPLVAASAQPGPAPSPDSPASSAMAAATAPATAPAAAARDPRTPRPMRWAEYNAQKPKWSAKNCDADTRMVAKATSTKKLPVTAECARIKTPLDWSDLTKGSITLNITRVNRPAVKAKRPAARGLFVNPGGPGGAAGVMVPALAATKPALRATHDIVGVDPRGTGLSTPLPCDPLMPVAADYRNPSAKVRAAMQASYKSWVTTCVAKQGKILPYITTTNTVHDQDLVRRIIGYPKLDWMGVSGGSWMGAWYAQLHPKQAGRIVLDSNTQFTTDWRTSFADMPMGVQRRYDQQFLPWLARQHKTYGLGSTTKATRASVERLRAQVGKGRVTGMTPFAFDLSIFQALYQDEAFPVLAQAMSTTTKSLAKTKGKVTMRLPGDDVQLTPALLATTTVRTAILCNDGPYLRTPASFEKEFGQQRAKYSLLGPNFGFLLGPCAYWPYKPKPAPSIDGSGGVPTMLMVQNELDPATPIEGARKAHAANRATRLVVAKGQGAHGAFFSGVPNPCVDKATLTFRQQGTLPAKDLTCAGLPLPGEKKVYDYTTG